MTQLQFLAANIWEDRTTSYLAGKAAGFYRVLPAPQMPAYPSSPLTHMLTYGRVKSGITAPNMWEKNNEKVLSRYAAGSRLARKALYTLVALVRTIR